MNAHTRPSARQIQPTGFRGRLEAIRAPTTGKARKDTKTSRSSAIPLLLAGSQLLGTWTDRPRTNSATFAADMASVRQASDHASQAAARLFVPPTPRARSLAPAVTTPLYGIIVSQALRNALRSQVKSQPPRFDLFDTVRKGGTQVAHRPAHGNPLGADQCGALPVGAAGTYPCPPLPHHTLRLERPQKGPAGHISPLYTSHDCLYPCIRTFEREPC